LLLASSVRAQAPQQKSKYTGPICIGEFCFDDHLMSESGFVARYGKSPASSRAYCYRIPDQSLFARFEATHERPGQIVEVFISDKPNCLPSSITRLPRLKFDRFITKEGIALGDTEAKVIATYGPPNLVEKGTGEDIQGLSHQKANSSAPFGSKVLFYSAILSGIDDDLRHAGFYIREGRVAAILVSGNE
jgi:hypothetical protein